MGCEWVFYGHEWGRPSSMAAAEVSVQREESGPLAVLDAGRPLGGALQGR